MRSTTNVPSLLQAYLELLSESSLVLITSMLGATSNWLVLRFLCQIFSAQDATSESVSVLHVSFLREGMFWQQAAQRLGLDLARLQQTKQYTFLDGLSALFLEHVKVDKAVTQQVLSSPEPEKIFTQVCTAIRAINNNSEQSKVVLIIDGLDILLAATDNVTSVALEEMVIDLREEVYATVLSLSADLPLVTSLQTPLERNHAAFLLSIAHQADLVMNLRTLDTGTAKDVSGVMRITNNGSDEEQMKVESKELLYFVGGDSKVKIFERGQYLH